MELNVGINGALAAGTKSKLVMDNGSVQNRVKQITFADRYILTHLHFDSQRDLFLSRK